LEIGESLGRAQPPYSVAMSTLRRPAWIRPSKALTSESIKFDLSFEEGYGSEDGSNGSEEDDPPSWTSPR
jgi:hypothetical protein